MDPPTPAGNYLRLHVIKVYTGIEGVSIIPYPQFPTWTSQQFLYWLKRSKFAGL
jgi:hypothetical protein